MNKIVVSAVIQNDKKEVLAVHLNKEKPEGVWVMPGGKLEDGETARECVIREVKEELGVKISVRELVAVGEVNYDESEVWVFLYYIADIVQGDPTPQEENKTLAVRYVRLDEIHLYQNIQWLKRLDK